MKRVLVAILLLGVVHCAAYCLALRGQGGFDYGCYDQNCYAQAARRIAAGHPFSYAPDQPPTTGQTSVLYPFVLSVPMMLGVEGHAINAASLALAVAFYLIFLFGWGVVIATALQPGGFARPAGVAALALSGAAAYVAFSQCDQGLWMAVSALIAAALARNLRVALTMLLMIAPWIRPEGMMVVAAFAAFRALTVIRVRCLRLSDAMEMLLPVLSAAGVFALNFALTGEAQFSSVADKGYFKFLPFGLAAGRIAEDALAILGAYLCSVPIPLKRTFCMTSPVVAVGFWIAVVWFVRHPAGWLSRPFVFVLAAAMSIVSTSLGGFAGLDFDRYLAWALPVPIIMGAWGLGWLSDRIRSSLWRKLPMVLLVTTVLFSAVAMVLMMKRVSSGRARYFRNLREEARLLPPAARVGSEDFIWAYELPPDCRYRELSGIFTPDFRGSALFYGHALEILKHRPETRFDYWVCGPLSKERDTPHNRAERLSLHGKPLDSMAKEPLIMRADWSAYDRAVRPDIDVGGLNLVDSLDVGLRDDERRTRRKTFGRKAEDGVCFRSVAKRASDGLAQADACVIVTKGERFTLKAEAGRPARLILRTLGRVWYETMQGTDEHFDFGAETKLEISVNGRPVGAFAVPLKPDTFTDFAIDVPAEYVTARELEFTVSGRYSSFAWWLFQDETSP